MYLRLRKVCKCPRTTNRLFLSYTQTTYVMVWRIYERSGPRAPLGRPLKGQTSGQTLGWTLEWVPFRVRLKNGPLKGNTGEVSTMAKWAHREVSTMEKWTIGRTEYTIEKWTLWRTEYKYNGEANLLEKKLEARATVIYIRGSAPAPPFPVFIIFPLFC